MARLAQSAERKALNLVVVGSNPTVGAGKPGKTRENAGKVCDVEALKASIFD